MRPTRPSRLPGLSPTAARGNTITTTSNILSVTRLARNGRLNYAKQLGKFINVDIYGACGAHRCPRTSAAKCFNLLNQDYKFYLAFENSNCKDYITEKFFVNGLG